MHDRTKAPALLIVAIAVAGCGPSVPESKQPGSTVHQGLERFMPMDAGVVYTYETRSEDSPESGVLMLEITRPRPKLVELLIAGRPQQLEIGADGIRYTTGGYLLREPLTVGTEYKGKFGTVRVVDTDRAVATPAGPFEHCLETLESAPLKRATTVFCPDVGMVLLDVESLSAENPGRETATLKAFGPKIDVRELDSDHSP